VTRLEITIRNHKVDMFCVVGDMLPTNANAEIVRAVDNILERYQYKEKKKQL